MLWSSTRRGRRWPSVPNCRWFHCGGTSARCRARATGRCRACGGFSIEAVHCGFPARQNSPGVPCEIVSPSFPRSVAIVSVEPSGRACDTLRGDCAADQWLAESIRFHRTSWDFLFSLRNGFTAYFVLFPVNGFLATVADGTSHRLSASTAAPEPHDFAVRDRSHSSIVPSRPPHPTARFVTIASRPSCRVGRAQE